MKISNLFFHIHYCNGRNFKDSGNRKYSTKITRTLNHHELLLVKGGEGSVTIQKKGYPIREGMLFYIGPDMLHTIDMNPEVPGAFLSVHFSYTNVSFNEGRWEIGKELGCLPLHPAQELKDYYLIEDLFQRLVDGWFAKEPGYEFLSRTLLQQLLAAVFINTRRQSKNYAASLKVERIIQYMHQKINSRVTLAELSELVQLAPTYLSRSFRQVTGYSVIEYFNKMKIDKSKELIMEGNRKIKEVAQELGFTDEFYFSRIFKSLEGISPSEYCSKNVHGV